MPVYLHAADAAAMPATYAGHPELEGATWSWTAETAAHTPRIIFGGMFERFPRAELLLGHMGETLPFLLWRLDKRAQAFATGDRVRPLEMFRRNVAITTAGTFSDEPLDCALKALGQDAVVFSVDHPFEDMALSPWFLMALTHRLWALGIVVGCCIFSALIPFSPDIEGVYDLRIPEGPFGGLVVPLPMATALRVLTPDTRAATGSSSARSGPKRTEDGARAYHRSGSTIRAFPPPPTPASSRPRTRTPSPWSGAAEASHNRRLAFERVAVTALSDPA